MFRSLKLTLLSACIAGFIYFLYAVPGTWETVMQFTQGRTESLSANWEAARIRENPKCGYYREEIVLLGRGRADDPDTQHRLRNAIHAAKSADCYKGEGED